MSIKLMSKIWEKDLNHSEQSILIAMADFASDDGSNCYPSVGLLAWKSGYSDRQTTAILKSLVSKKYLTIVKAATNRASTHYKINVENMADKPPYEPKSGNSCGEISSPQCDSRDEEISPQNDGFDSRGEISSPLGVKFTASRGEEISPDPLYNHYTNINIVVDKPQQPTSSLDEKVFVPTPEPVGNSDQQNNLVDDDCKKRSGKRPKRDKSADNTEAEQPEHRQMWEAVFYITHLHKEFKLSTKEMDMAIGKAAKKLRELGYGLDDLRNWYRNIWSKEFPGLQDGKVQRATIGQIVGGVGRVRNCSVPDFLNGPTSPSARSVGVSVYKALPELER